ncbi:MAG: PAS domain-containing protein [bacterium]|nr:PAS domain-containing protein [bacterium]
MSDALTILLDLLDEGVCLLDASGMVERWSAAAESITGVPAAEAIGRPLARIAPGALETFERERAVDVFAVSFPAGEGTGKPLSGRARPLVCAGKGEGWVWVFRDEQRLREIDQLKAEFVGTISHELRTPLTSIKAYTATLRTNPSLDEPTRAEFLQIVEQEADRLTRLVDDLLVVARVDSGLMLKRRQRVPLQELLDRVLTNLARDPAQHPVRLDLAGVEVSGDPDRLYEVFANLLENAVKYSPKGGEIGVSAERGADGAVVIVRDRGAGVPEGELPYIFDQFYRVDNHLTASAGGSGLGLYIVRSIVRAHGGTIDVCSNVGQGTTFTISLPDRSA